MSPGRFAAPRVIMALMLREMATRYGRSPGGYLWAVLDPLGTTLILAIAMSVLFAAPPLGSSFVLFKASGMMPFTVYTMVSGAISHAINFSRPLLRYPGVSWIDAIIARLILNVMTCLLIVFLILGGTMLWSDTRALPDVPMMLLSFCLAVGLGLGVGCGNIWFFMRYPVWEHCWNIVNRPMFLVSGVMFLPDQLPASIQNVLWYNPISHIIAIMRMGIYPLYAPTWVSVPYVLVCSLVPLVFGLIWVRRHHRDLLNI